MWCVGLIVIYCHVQQQPATAGARFCDVAKPITWSAKDTRRTKEMIDEHNRVGVRLCGWGR
jgi:hypothetical protein